VTEELRATAVTVQFADKGVPLSQPKQHSKQSDLISAASDVLTYGAVPQAIMNLRNLTLVDL
jgi:hypothetical protein